MKLTGGFLWGAAILYLLLKVDTTEQMNRNKLSSYFDLNHMC